MDFFFRCVNLACFQIFLSFSAYKTVHMCSNCAYLPLLEFIKGQLKLFMTLPLFVVIKC